MDKALKAAVVEISMGDWSKRPTTATSFLAQAILQLDQQLDQQMAEMQATQVHSEYVKLNREMIQELTKRVKALETQPFSQATTAQEETQPGESTSSVTFSLVRVVNGESETMAMVTSHEPNSPLDLGQVLRDLADNACRRGWLSTSELPSQSGATLQTPPLSGAAGIKVGDCSCAESVLEGYRKDYGRATRTWNCPVHGIRTLAAYPGETL